MRTGIFSLVAITCPKKAPERVRASTSSCRVFADYFKTPHTNKFVFSQESRNQKRIKRYPIFQSNLAIRLIVSRLGEKSALVLIFTLFESLYPPHQSQFLRYNQIGTEGGLMRTAIVLGCYRHVCVRPSKEAAVARLKAVAETDYR